MYRSRDFSSVKILNEQGKRIGVAMDIYIDITRGKVIGIKVANYSIRNRRSFVRVEDIISFKKNIIVKKLDEGSFLKFFDIKDMEVIDKEGNIKGNVLDILIDEVTFEIKGIIVSPGIIDKILIGKEVFLTNKLLLKDDYILYTGGTKVAFKNIPHQDVKI